MKALRIAALGAAMVIAGQAYAAVDAIPYWTQGGWKVSAIPSRGKCLAQASYTMPDGSDTYMAFEAFIDNSAAILVSSKNWSKMFRDKKKYWVNVAVDNAKPQRLLALGYANGSIAFESLTFDAIKAFAEGNQIRFFYKGQNLASLNLPGSWDAVDHTVGCIRTMQKAIAGNADVNDGTGPVEEETAPMQVKPAPAPAAPAAPEPKGIEL